MSIQDSPKQIALTNEQLQGIKNKFATMLASMTSSVEMQESPKVVETPEITPTPEVTPNAADVPATEASLAETPAPEINQDNIFDQNIFAPIEDTPTPSEPVMSDVPASEPASVPVSEEIIPEEGIQEEIPGMGPVRPKTNEELAAELEDISRKIIEIYVELDRVMNELSRAKEMNNSDIKLDTSIPAPENNIFSM